MTTAHATTSKNQKKVEANFSPALHGEVDELEALSSGLRRHLSAWRGANETAILRLGAVMARIDAVVERIERARVM
ncbi:MAG: hypothetical protein JNK07_01900 [Alphaproteobacteria bacterium]|nr:hypothetical protein [Alphaproteobacteria bacterium]